MDEQLPKHSTGYQAFLNWQAREAELIGGLDQMRFKVPVDADGFVLAAIAVLSSFCEGSVDHLTLEYMVERVIKFNMRTQPLLCAGTQELPIAGEFSSVGLHNALTQLQDHSLIDSTLDGWQGWDSLYR